MPLPACGLCREFAIKGFFAMLPADREVEEGRMIDFKGSHFEKELKLRKRRKG